MAIIYKQKCSPADLSAEQPNQALVILEDGIWKLAKGRIDQTLDGNLFIFIHEGQSICVNESSYRKLFDDTSDLEAYDIVCRFNVDNLKLKKKKGR